MKRWGRPLRAFTEPVRKRINELAAEMATAIAELESSESAVTAIQDVYLQGGTDAGKVSTSFSNYDAAKLQVKYSDGNQSYTRKTLLKFDLSSAAGDTKGGRAGPPADRRYQQFNPAKRLYGGSRTKDRQPVGPEPPSHGIQFPEKQRKKRQALLQKRIYPVIW